MAGLATQKLEHIEQLLVDIDMKIDNFLGFEELTGKELKELRETREAMKRGEYATFEDVFSDID
jgi:hypothetical protein